MSNQPPKWPLRFLRWFCKREYLDEIEGDLVELYHLRLAHSRKKADLFFFWNVFRSFRFINLKSITMFNSSGIIKSYFKIGIRSLSKDIRFSLINLLGLSIGLSVFLAIVLLVHHELSFDKFHSKADRIYQVIQVFKNADGEDPEIFTSNKLSEALRNDVLGVENAVTLNTAAGTWAEMNGKRFFEEDGIISGPQFFEIFDFKLLAGNPSEVLTNKRSIVISESLARKYFEYADPIGEEIELDSYGRFTISGILEDVPPNSYIQFNFIITQDMDVYFENASPRFRTYFESWTGDPGATYVLLEEQASKEHFEAQMPGLLKKYLGEDVEINRHYLLSLLDLHFNSNGIDGRINLYLKGDFRKVQILIIIALVILAMACLNYINISTARYIKRTREVGVRKAMGAHNAQVTYQFLTESFIMVLSASIIGLALTYFMLPVFNALTGIQLAFSQQMVVSIIPYFLVTIVLVTLLAGFYPAFYLSRFSAVSVLKNLTVSAKGNGTLRRMLVGIQYIFVITIVSTLIIVSQQYHYMSNKSLGFDTEEMVIVEINSGGVRNNYASLKTDLLNLPDVQSVTGLTRMISGYRSGTSVSVGDIELPEQKHAMRFYGMDKDGISTLELEIVSGADFSGQNSLDSVSVLLNETAAELYGGNNIIGNYLEIEELGDDVLRAKVIGIVKDFHYRSFHESIGPVVIGFYNNPFVSLDDIVIKLSGFNMKAALEDVKKAHDRFDDRGMFTLEFMDDMVQRAYEKELVFRNIFVGASVISLCIALLGMIGMTSYSIVSRTKEIGIRKILGATFVSLLNLEVRELVKYLALAAAIAIPVSWWLSIQWLANFEYRIAVSPFVFAAVILFILIIAVSIVFFIGNKVAKAPAVNAIRQE